MVLFSKDSPITRTIQSGLISRRLFTSYRVLPLEKLEKMLHYFSPFERAVLYLFSVTLGASVFTLLVLLNFSLTHVVPSRGGSLTEGVVGTPRFVNPLLAISEADRDISALVYSGLMRATPENIFVPDLAEKVDISENGTEYIFTIRDGAFFHDKTPVTASDVAFTIGMAQNPDIKSSRRSDWEGVSVEEIDEKTIRITLPHPYAPFLETATMGILPKHLWQNVPLSEFPFHDLNTHPVGSGPYTIRRIKFSGTGTPERYTLKAYKYFTLGRPYIDAITFYFFPNEDELITAYNKGSIESAAGITPDQMRRVSKQETVVREPLPRVFAVFFNQTKAAVFTDSTVRKALSISLDKKAIIDDNLMGYGVPVDSPVLEKTLSQNTKSDLDKDLHEKAIVLLEKGGWVLGKDGIRVNKKGVRLAFSIATADTLELAGTADSVARAWRTLGADVTVKVFSSSDLTNTVIRPRDFEALLFGEVVGRSLDLFAFWHSSQRNDPGLNVALYTNAKTDKLLQNARKDNDPARRMENISAFVKIINEEIPAVFLYAPEFIYIIPNGIQGVRLGSLTTSSERFLNVYEWHRETERVWDLFYSTSN